MEGVQRPSISRLLLPPSWSIIPAFALGMVGCTTIQTSAPMAGGMALSQNSPPVVTKADDDKDKPKQAPKASTCAAFGTFNLKASVEQKDKPAQVREQMLDQARRAFQQALKTDPDCMEAWLGLGQTYHQLGDEPRAIETFMTLSMRI